jgi:hypothetical protein
VSKNHHNHLAASAIGAIFQVNHVNFSVIPHQFPHPNSLNLENSCQTLLVLINFLIALSSEKATFQLSSISMLYVLFSQFISLSK